MNHTRVTVTLPSPLVEQIDRMEQNRSRFVLEAVQREVERRQREQLWLSLENPHAESPEVAEEGVEEWLAGLPRESDDLILPGAVRPVQWTPGIGWESR